MSIPYILINTREFKRKVCGKKTNKQIKARKVVNNNKKKRLTEKF